jgi:hypothetical protein
MISFQFRMVLIKKISCGTILQFCFTVCLQEGPRNPDGMETEQTHHLLICVAGTSLMNKNISTGTTNINIIAFLGGDKYLVWFRRKR